MQTNFDLSNYNTLAMPATAKMFIAINNHSELAAAMALSAWHDNRKIILGGGSNVFFAADYQGIVVHPQFLGKELIAETNESALIKFGAGEIWDDCVQFCVDHNYFGIENLSGIPGSMGAAPVQNIGAYGVELDSSFIKLDAINLTTGEEKTFTKDDCKFAYRNSIFKHELRDKFIITAVYLNLNKQFQPILTYSDLKDLSVTELSAQELRQKIISIRNSKLPKPTEIPNAGSFFKNPIISQELAHKLAQEYPHLPKFAYGDNKFKISAGWLIEQAGLKGYTHGTASTHSNHALVLTNSGRGTATQFAELIALVQEKVHTKFAVQLESEVRIIE